jgi:hypothetical protein
MNPTDSIVRSRAAKHAVSLLVGLVIGVFFHYLLFRLTLPVQPFIYVAF